jgi:hypothetical protein
MKQLTKHQWQRWRWGGHFKRDVTRVEHVGVRHLFIWGSESSGKQNKQKNTSWPSPTLLVISMTMQVCQCNLVFIAQLGHPMLQYKPMDAPIRQVFAPYCPSLSKQSKILQN